MRESLNGDVPTDEGESNVVIGMAVSGFVFSRRGDPDDISSYNV